MADLQFGRNFIEFQASSPQFVNASGV